MRLVAGRNTRANAETMLLLAWTEFVVLMKWGAEVCFLRVLFAGESVSREGKVRTTSALGKQIMNM
jgi:hypothetical protein